jgi:hypothetical protein
LYKSDKYWVSYDQFRKTDPKLEIFASAPFVPQTAVMQEIYSTGKVHW